MTVYFLLVPNNSVEIDQPAILAEIRPARKSWKRLCHQLASIEIPNRSAGGDGNWRPMAGGDTLFGVAKSNDVRVRRVRMTI